VISPSGFWGGALAEIEFGAFQLHKKLVAAILIIFFENKLTKFANLVEF